MVEVLTRARKSPVLTPSSLPCLQDVATLNVSEGCALGCRYCYIQGYSHYPGPGRVVVYVNLAELVAAELKRKRKKPRRVYFSPSSDAFQDLPQVQDVALRTMKVILDAGVEIAFLTKGFVQRPFLELFAAYADSVFAQIGVTTLDHDLWRALEPGTAPPAGRIASIEAMEKIGVRTTVRLDPLIPDITDAVDNILPLLHALGHAGVRDAAASYLFTRPLLEQQITAALSSVTSRPPGASRSSFIGWMVHEFAPGAGRGRMIGVEDRARRFTRLQALGNSAGIRIRPCRCKNPGLVDEPCAITGPRPGASASGTIQSQFGFATDGYEGRWALPERSPEADTCT
jgi:DNA repair photolyase